MNKKKNIVYVSIILFALMNSLLPNSLHYFTDVDFVKKPLQLNSAGFNLDSYNNNSYQNPSYHEKKVISYNSDHPLFSDNQHLYMSSFSSENSERSILPDLSFQESIQSYDPELVLEAFYKEQKNGTYPNSSPAFTFPGDGHYTVSGHVTNAQSQFFNNPNAVLDSQFYSENAQIIGSGLKREYSSKDNRTDWSWKFAVNSTNQVSYTIYQENLYLYGKNIVLNYDLLLDSNSTIESVTNSSIIFDFVFDSCRITITNWHSYTFLESLGFNTTSPFLTYRLTNNQNWDDMWSHYHLNVTDLMGIDNPALPSYLKSFGIFVVSPEYSETSFSIDNFELKSEVLPSKIDLCIEEYAIPNLNSSEFSVFNYAIDYQIGNSNLYEIFWSHNSTYDISFNFQITIESKLCLPYNNSLNISESGLVLYSINFTSLDVFLSQINFVYPSIMSFYSTNITTATVDEFYLNSSHSITSISPNLSQSVYICSFIVQNIIESVITDSLSIFETIEVTLQTTNLTNIDTLILFWNTTKNGCTYISLEENIFTFTFPSSLSNGVYNITLLSINQNIFGYYTFSITLMRLPSNLSLSEEIVLPQYSYSRLNFSYDSLIIGECIVKPNIQVTLGEYNLQVHEVDESNYFFYISTYYLENGNHKINFNLSSVSHATIEKSITFSVTKSSLNISVQHFLLSDSLTLRFSVKATVEHFPVAFAPFKLNITNYSAFYGLTDEKGFAYLDLLVSKVDNTTYLECSFLGLSGIISSVFLKINLNKQYAKLILLPNEILLNETLVYHFEVTYTSNHSHWFATLPNSYLPIYTAYIKTQSQNIPVNISGNNLFWHVNSNILTNNHCLIIETKGTSYEVSSTSETNKIYFNIVINPPDYYLNNVSLLYLFNESIISSDYTWILYSKNKDVTNEHSLTINDFYIYIKNITLFSETYLLFDLEGQKFESKETLLTFVVPTLSGTLLLSSSAILGIRSYKKKKSFILEI